VYSSTRRRWFDVTVAGSFGIVISLLVIQAQNLQLAKSISTQLSEWSYTLAKGKNIVNVILVDFRALDTMGEIIVLIIAGLGVTVLLSSRRKQVKEEDAIDHS
ncbi:MAG: hydrogen gas-evolving membrane-bound hydrogenase subunit E, partial [Verrucomicrobiota bacterium]